MPSRWSYLRTLSKDAFVVVKLDIDNLEAELQILSVIEAYVSVVDELFFEYHYYFDGLNFGWGKNRAIGNTHNVTTALRTMRRLREKGIRAHFWI